MPHSRPRTPDQRTLRIGWLALVVVLAGLVGASAVVDLPTRVTVAASGLLGTSYAVGLAVRAGGRVWLPVVVGLLMVGATTATLDSRLLAGSATATAVVAAVLGILSTVPAPTMRVMVREVLVASVVATLGGVAVWGFSADLHQGRFDYSVLVGALFVSLAIVFQLGAGFHGLGRRGYVVCLVALGALGVTLAYSEALSRWGSADVLANLDDLRTTIRDALGAVPHPTETLFGLPALAWGVFMRSRRRQGWWVAAFGAGATAAAAGRLVEVADTGTIALGAVYSLVLGLLLGFLVIRVDLLLTGGGGRRANRGAETLRPEPSRFSPLQ